MGAVDAIVDRTSRVGGGGWVDELALLVASMLSWLRGVLATDVCPGDWAWATTAFGALVSLLPAGGAVAMAWLRGRTRGSVLVAIALVTGGLLPWLAFSATGSLFSRAAAGAAIGLPRADRVSLASRVCFGESQQSYLGSVAASEALTDDSLRSFVLFTPLVVFPLVAVFLVWTQGRMALRRGPRWPNRFLWLPMLLIAVASLSLPAGATAQLWTGVVFGGTAGLFAVSALRPPVRATRHDRAARQPAFRPGSDRPAQPAARLTQPRDRGAAWLRRARSWLDGAPDRMQSRLVAEPAPRVPAPRLPMQQPPSSARRPPATLIGPPSFEPARFELVRQLGAGGFGGVWLARDHARRQHVAVKAAHAPDPNTEQRIRREARALAAVRHPNCVPIYDLVDSKLDPGLSRLHGLVIVMGYLEGSSLDELVRHRGPLDDVAVARIWAALADALNAAHHHGVLHRDVKPGNVLVDRGGRPYLIDFGIARGRSDATLTLHGFVLGTPDFLAPEVARGAPASAASDTYQLAATMSYALTGSPPRGSHEDAMDGLRAAASGTPPTFLPAAGAHVGLLRACLAESPAARPSLATVRATLEQWLAAGRRNAGDRNGRRGGQHTPPELTRARRG